MAKRKSFLISTEQKENVQHYTSIYTQLYNIYRECKKNLILLLPTPNISLTSTSLSAVIPPLFFRFCSLDRRHVYSLAFIHYTEMYYVCAHKKGTSKSYQVHASQNIHRYIYSSHYYSQHNMVLYSTQHNNITLNVVKMK